MGNPYHKCLQIGVKIKLTMSSIALCFLYDSLFFGLCSLRIPTTLSDKGPLDKPLTIPERKNLDSATVINLSNTPNTYVTITESKNLVSITNRLLPFPQTTLCLHKPQTTLCFHNRSVAFTNRSGASTNLSPCTKSLPFTNPKLIFPSIYTLPGSSFLFNLHSSSVLFHNIPATAKDISRALRATPLLVLERLHHNKHPTMDNEPPPR